MSEHLPSDTGPIYLAMATLSALNMVGLPPLSWTCLNETEVCVNRHEPVLNATSDEFDAGHLQNDILLFGAMV